MIEDEMDENCVVECRPGEHKCDRSKVVTITLIQVGRFKVNDEFVVPKLGRTEEQLAELALERVKSHLMSQDVMLEPDEAKGAGFWKVRVGMGYTLGDVEIKL